MKRKEIALKYTLTALASAAAACLFMLLLSQPLLRPLDTNTAAVVAAISSAVLAVIGAFVLWIQQTRTKQAQLEQTYAPIFQPVYEGIGIIREVATEAGAKRMANFIASKLPVESRKSELSPIELARFQKDTLSTLVIVTSASAKSAIDHWASIQDIPVNIKPSKLKNLLELHRITSMLIETLPDMHNKAKPGNQHPLLWQFTIADAELVKWKITQMAKALNGIDGGQRDESGTVEFVPSIEIMVEVLSRAPGN